MPSFGPPARRSDPGALGPSFGPAGQLSFRRGVLSTVAQTQLATLDKPDPAPFTALETAQLGGQGIPLIKRLTQQARYDRRGQCNCVTAVFPVD